VAAAVRAIFTAACALWACSACGRKPDSVDAVEQRAASALPPSALPPNAVNTPSPSAAPLAGEDPEWEHVTIEDEVPLCVFADHLQRGDALFLEDVHRQTLHADSSVVFGTFAPGCQNEACDALPTHSCWVDATEPSTLVVHSSLSFKHKLGAVCTKDCRPVVAGCETPVLKAGKYTVKYGTRIFSLRVPSVMSKPCFELD
jgi:hypothetical protein